MGTSRILIWKCTVYFTDSLSVTDTALTLMDLLNTPEHAGGWWGRNQQHVE